ncbi:MAG: restriction endonuclease subunit S [Bacteroidales bacterium]|nr:restriction endonuclease subunit S [Bacteroidales bacterium]
MKHDWEYKKLGEISTIAAGQGAPQGDSNYSTQGTPFIKAGNLIDLINGIDENNIQKVTEDVAKSHKLRLYPSGSILFAKSGMSCMKGYVYTTKNDCYVVSHLAIVIPTKINASYLNFFLQVKKPNSLVKDEAYPSISLKDISDIEVPYPTKGQQTAIVSELDSLSKIIADCKETLKDYDALEQSIFYDMFGDPVKNEKGWEVKKLGEVCSKITDGTHSSPENTSEGDRMYITAKNIKKDGIELKNITYVSEEVHRSIYDRCNPEYGDVLYIKDGITTGIATINTLNEEFTLLSSVALIKVGDNLNNYFLKGLMNFESFYEMVRGNMGGAAITRLTLAKINNITIIFPPLPLQQQFASKIEAIEQMKVETKKALQEAETLFQARMDYWFN